MKKRKSHKRNQTYRFLPLLRVYGQIIIGLMLCLLIMFGLTFFPTMGNGGRLLLFLGWLPFFAFGCYLFGRHSGQVRLTDEAIVLHRFGRTTQIAYQDVTSVQTHDWWLPPNMVFSSASKRLRFSTLLEQRPLFYHFLRYRIPALRAHAVCSFPWRLQPPKRYVIGEVSAVVILLAGLGFAIRWSVLYAVRNPVGNDAIWILMIVLAALIVALPFGLVLAHTGRAWRFSAEPDTLTLSSAWNTTQAWPIQTIRQIAITPRIILLDTAPQVTQTDYVIRMTLVDESHVTLDLAQISKWGLSLETFFYRLHDLYGNRPIHFVVLGQSVHI